MQKSKENIESRIEQSLLDTRINFAVGVPCGVLRTIISVLSNSFSGVHVAAQNEPEAIGIASGASLAGDLPLVYMQNSGLLKSINDISSLPKLYGLPMILAVSHRGCEGEDAPQHTLTGKITEEIINLMHIPIYHMTKDNVKETFFEAAKYARSNNAPAVILVKRGWVENTREEFKDTPEYYTFTDFRGKLKGNVHSRRRILLKRDNALACVLKETDKNTAIISTTGLISRSIYECNDAPNIFYNVGAFGLASSLGLGFSLSKPETKTIVIDGDSSLLTNLGSLVTIGHAKPKNLTHIILDNNSYASCSEEHSCSENAKFSQSAILHGYKESYLAFDEAQISYYMKKAIKIDGPTLIHIPISLGGRRDFKRPKETKYLAQRFMRHFDDQNTGE